MRALPALWILIATVGLHASSEEAARKVLSSRCWACHAETALGQLRLDSKEAMIRGGKSGAAIIPGSAAKSRIYQAVTRAPGVKPMPPGGPLTPGEVTATRVTLHDDD